MRSATRTLLTRELHDRILTETDAGRVTADFAFSSAIDLQIKLANDGYAREAVTPDSAGWPRWANWRDTTHALTFQPAVLVYHRPAFRDRPAPASRLDLMDLLARGAAAVQGKVGTYDIERSAVGFLFPARDQEHFPDIRQMIAAMGRPASGSSRPARTCWNASATADF